MSDGPNDATFWGVVSGLAGAGVLVWRAVLGRLADLRREKADSHAEQWRAINALTGKLASHETESERRFAHKDDVQKLREHIDRQFERVHEKLDAQRRAAAGE